MTHWMLDSIAATRADALKDAARSRVLSAFERHDTQVDFSAMERSAQVLEMVVMDVLSDPTWREDSLRTADLRSAAADAYKLYRSLPPAEQPLEQSEALLRLSCLAVLGDQGSDVARFLKESQWDLQNLQDEDWSDRTYSNVLDVWLRLIRKQGWQDRDLVLQRVAELRQAQNLYEAEHLQRVDRAGRRTTALQLVCMYHLAKAAEILALFITDGRVDGNYQVNALLDMQFDRAIEAAAASQDYRIEPITRLLAATSAQLVENCIWTVTRAVNSRVTRFVENLVARGRGEKAIFEVLPPQRVALAEQGLLGSSRRAVVVSLPTSSGKTLIAQFRILQALNQYDEPKGWAAYLAPTRTLVRQVAHRLRRDFGPLGVVVEQVSPALEVDSVEADILRASDANCFRVLVTTPEKLDLLLRQGWEEKVGRPLTLVVVDEAHNIQDDARGMKLELLLATINAECQNAQFLLLTPFISNGREVARWLGGQNSDDISLAFDWQPNDRVIGVAVPKRGLARSRRSFGCSIEMQTVHTTRKTLAIDEVVAIAAEDMCGTFSDTSNPGEVAAITAVALATRGPVISMHSTPKNAWALAAKIRARSSARIRNSPNVLLVKEFLSHEMGGAFPLVDHLSHGIGVHHAGLSDDIRALMEWLFEEGELSHLVATTTIAQGVNFPVAGVVMAATQHYVRGVGQRDMSAEDFWNVAGRAGRVDQGLMGVVALASPNDSRAEQLKKFINRQTSSLNSSLERMVDDAGEFIDELGTIVFKRPEWSAFMQYLTHTYSQMGRPEAFSDQIEQVLRGTFGFSKLRSAKPDSAGRLLRGVRAYAEQLAGRNQPIKLVDSTGFSLESVVATMRNARNEGITANSWNAQRLFSPGDQELPKMMGVLLSVPELRENLRAVTGGASPDGRVLSEILKDWVNGVAVSDIAIRYFSSDGEDEVEAITKCGQNLFGKLTQTAAWGLGALLSITAGAMDESELEKLNGLASKAYYGVSSGEAVALRLLGVPRSAAEPLAANLRLRQIDTPTQIKRALYSEGDGLWRAAMGDDRGMVYMKVWQVLEGT